MECFCLCNSTSTPPTLPFHKAVINLNGHNFPSNFKNPKLFCPSLSTPKYTVNCNCRERTKGEAPLSGTSAYAVLGVEPDCSASELKAAFRAKVQWFISSLNKFLLSFFICLIAKKIWGKELKKKKKRRFLSSGFCCFGIWLPRKLRKEKKEFWVMGFCFF